MQLLFAGGTSVMWGQLNSSCLWCYIPAVFMARQSQGGIPRKQDLMHKFYQASTHILFADVLWAKASPVAKPRINVVGKNMKTWILGGIILWALLV